VEEPLDEMPPEERAASIAQLDRGVERVRRGDLGIPASDVIRNLRAR
jgi:hypothetical protein